MFLGYNRINIPVIPRSGMVTNNQYHWRLADVTYSNSLDGQGQPSPASLFENHQIAQIGSWLYDVSYGQDYSAGGTGDALVSPLDAVMDHYGRAYWDTTDLLLDESELGFDLDGDGSEDDAVRTQCIVIKDNPSGNQLEVQDTNLIDDR